MAVSQVPFTSSTTNACSPPELSTYSPPALQLPVERHDIEATSAPPSPALRAAVPGTSSALPQAPPVSVATNASPPEPLAGVTYKPPALQFPARSTTACPLTGYRALVYG